MKIFNSLKNFASFDDPKVARLVEIYQVLHFVLKFENSSAPIISSETSKVISKISVHDLMTIWYRVLLLIIGQNDINPKLLQPIVASICKVMTVKKPCVMY